MKELLPPHIAWPLFVVTLLVMGVSVAVGTLVMANSDGGAQVVEDYYRKALDWDAHAAEAAATAALGWRVDLAVTPGTSEAARILEVAFRDRDGRPVTGLSGTVRAFRPQWTAPVAVAPLAETGDAPGVYRMSLPLTQAGLWDFEITAARDTLRYTKTFRKDLP
ncbi:FixH family protein [Rhodocaloribacter sp.]